MAEVHTFPGVRPVDAAPAARVERPRRSRRVSLEKARKELAYDAASEIYAIAQLLLRETDVDQDELEDQFERFLIQRTMLHRVEALTSIVLSVLGGDDGRETTEMHEVVHHRAMTGPPK